MICYLDTSALVKLYVEEEGSALVMEQTRQSLLVATSKVAYAEARAAFARSRREGILDDRTYREVVANFKQEWPSFLALEISDPVLQRVDTVVDHHPLRGFDALHLASTLVLARRVPGENMIVGCWDVRLWESYRKEGFLLVPRERPSQ